MSKHTIKVCMGSSCFARGNCENLSFLEKYIKDHNLDADLELVGALCEGKCDLGPHVYVDNNEYDEVNIDKLQKILSSL